MCNCGGYALQDADATERAERASGSGDGVLGAGNRDSAVWASGGRGTGGGVGGSAGTVDKRGHTGGCEFVLSGIVFAEGEEVALRMGALSLLPSPVKGPLRNCR